MSAEAAVQTMPLTITDKDQKVTDDFNINPVSDNFSVIKADSSVSGGTITIDSKTIHAEGSGLGQLSKNSLIRTTGSNVYGEGGINRKNIGLTPGYEGTINLADGMKITGYVKGNGTSTMGIYEEGYDNLKTVVNTITKPFHRVSYDNNTGKPAKVTMNVGKNTTISMTGIQLANQTGEEEDNYFRNFAIDNDGGTLNVGDDSSLSATAYGRYAVTPAALYNSKYGVTKLGNNVTLTAKGILTEQTSGKGAEVYGLISRHDHEGDAASEVKGRQTVTAGDNLTITADLSCHNIDYDKPYSLMTDAVRLGYTDLTTGKNTILHSIQEDKGLGTYALYANHESTATFGDNLQAKVETRGTTYGAFGLYAQSGSQLTMQGKAAVTLQTADSHQTFGTVLYGSNLTAKGPYTIKMTSRGYNTQALGLYLEKDPSSGDASTVDTTGGKLAIGMDLQGNAVKDSGYYNQETTQYISDTAHLSALANDGGTAKLGAADLSLSYKGNMTEKTEVRGIGTLASGTTTATGPVQLTVSAVNTGTKASTQLFYGVAANDAGTIKLQDSVTANLTAKNMGSAYGVRTENKGTTEIGNGSVITLSTDADNRAVVRSENGGVTTFTGGARLSGTETALESIGEDSQINLQEKGTKVITGNLLSEDEGTINLDLNDSQSILTGKSIVNKGTTNLSLSEGSLWNMTGDSTVTDLKLNAKARINMAANPKYQTLQADHFAGSEGNLLMKTDLASETNGDKMTITDADAGSAAKVAVDDASLYNGQEVTGVKNLLLITDASKNASFVGQYLDKGGLWDVTPTIQRGDTVKDAAGNIIGDATQWYLTKVVKKANPDTRPLLKDADNDYALYRDSIDTLRQRLGELRFWQKASQAQKDDNSGIWARDTYSSYAGNGLESKENRFQLGFDHWSDRKSVYGLFGERGIANPHYAYGTGKNHSVAGAVYGTWFGDNGSYTDVVAKAGRSDVAFHTFGSYPDKADYRTWERSFSAEYGRTHTLNEHGLFLEPQAQLVFGHLDGENYTTSRGKTMHMASFNSRIGRLGFVFGQRRPEAARPFDYYLKASILHEFGGDRDFYLTAPDGETMSAAGHYRDTWYELGFGGTYHMNDRTYLYADASRTYGGTWNQKWRWNVGMQWAF